MIICKKTAFGSMLRHNLFKGIGRFLFSQEKMISEGGLKSIIVSKWINTIIKDQKDLQAKLKELKEIQEEKIGKVKTEKEQKEQNEQKEEKQKEKLKKEEEIKGRIREQNRESLRDKILKIPFSEITDEVQKAAEKNGSTDTWSVNKQSQKIFQKMRKKYFEQGVNFDLSVSYNQGRFRKAIGERSENKYAIFYPTHFSAGPIFKHIYQLQDRYLLLGTSGTGKSLSLVFMTMFSEIISRYLFESYDSPQSIFLLDSKLIIKIPKMFYVDISTADEDTIQDSIREQCEQLRLRSINHNTKNNIDYVRNLGRLFVDIKKKYRKKNIEVLVIRDQVNRLTGQYRKTKVLDSDKRQDDKQEATDNFKSMMKVIKMTNKLASSYPLQSASNNMEIGLVFNDINNILPFPQHDGLYVFRTPYTPFTWVTKREIANYLLFELTQRGYISNEEYQNLNQQPQKKQQIFKLFENLAVIPKNVTPKKIRQVLDNKQFKQDIQTCLRLQSRVKSINCFLINYFQPKQTDQNIQKYLAKNQLQQNYLRTAVFGFYINVANNYINYNQILNEMNKENNEQVYSANDRKAIEDKIEQFYNAFYTQRIQEIQEVQETQEKKQQLSKKLTIPLSKQITESKFNHDLFEIIKYKSGIFKVIPYLNPLDFFKCFSDKYYEVAPGIYNKFFQQNGSNLSLYGKFVFQQIFKMNSGHRFEEVIFNAFKTKNIKLNFLVKGKENTYREYFSLNSKQLFFLEFNQDIQKNSQSNFQDHFKDILEKTRQGSYFCLPSCDDKGQILSKNNPSIDFVIVKIFKEYDGSLKYFFHTFDATIGIPLAKIYQKKANKSLNLMTTFKDLKKYFITQIRSNQSTKSSFIKIKGQKSFTIQHHILGIEETNFSVMSPQLMNKVNGLTSIDFMNIKDFKITQIEPQKCNHFKLLQEINSCLLNKMPQRIFRK